MRSFITSKVLQKLRTQNTPQHRFFGALAAAAFFSGVVGYWLGSTSAISHSPRADNTLQQPVTIVDANAGAINVGDPANSSSVQSGQFSQTVGRLHADILTLRTLYRRLAEDAGIDLTDFELNNAIKPPTQSSDSDEALNTLTDELEQIKKSSSALGDWYELRSQARAFALSGPVVMHGELSSRFGWRKRPSTGEMKMHRGVDYSGQVGEPVLALADGIVSFEGAVHAYGNMVEILHAGGLRTRYAHNDSNTVIVGQRVEQGQIIAKLGSTGRSTGPHVHVEVHLNGEAVDPMLFIQ